MAIHRLNADAAIREVQRELGEIDAEIELIPRHGPGRSRSPSPRRRVSVLPLTGAAVDVFGHRGLFMVPLDRPRAMPAAATTVEPPALRPGVARVAPTDRQKSGLRRHCSSCARETEHVAWAARGRGSIPSIRWSAAEPADGTTICVDCGQWRGACSQPRPPTSSSWRRTPVATRADAASSADAADDWVSQTAAENEGMPPKREQQRPRRDSPRLTRGAARAPAIARAVQRSVNGSKQVAAGGLLSPPEQRSGLWAD
jgi:hypothetical protein